MKENTDRKKKIMPGLAKQRNVSSKIERVFMLNTQKKFSLKCRISKINPTGKLLPKNATTRTITILYNTL